MANITLTCQDGISLIYEQGLLCNCFQLITNNLSDFPDQREIDLKINSREVKSLLDTSKLEKLQQLSEWQALLDAMEYLQSKDCIKEEVHNVFADYMHYQHSVDMILSYEAYTYDDYRQKMKDPTFMTDEEKGVLSTFKSLWG